MTELVLWFLALLVPLFSPALAQNNRFVFHTFKPLVVARIDPIISPGKISQHAHMVIGGSNFDKTYDPVKLRQSKCSNMAVQADKSNYWQPVVYKVHKDKKYEAMQSSTRVYYEFRKPSDLPKNQQTEVFPFDHRMVAGNPMRKSLDLNAWDAAGQWWMRWTCSGPNGAGGETSGWTIPKTRCRNLSMKVFFPVCWNGKKYNYQRPYDHMRYPVTGGYNGERCPDSHPRRLPSVLMETFFYNSDKGDFHTDRKYILANGDTTGYGLHADFANGWDQKVLAAAIKDCYQPSVSEPANQACKHFAASYDEKAAQYCMYQNQIPDEQVGYKGRLLHMPGCNPTWTKGKKPACTRKYYAKSYKFNPRWVKPKNDVFQWSFWETWT